MQLVISFTNRAILRFCEDIQGNRWTVEGEVSDLPPDVPRQLADLLFEDTFACEGVVNEAGAIEPRLGEYGEPILLRVDGTDLRDLVETIRRDQRAVEECLADARSEMNLAEAQERMAVPAPV